MARVCLIDDDATQLELRRLILEYAGHVVVEPGGDADAVVMDLHIPSLEEGLALIRLQYGKARICVLSGFVHDLNGRPEAGMVDKILAKPVRTEMLLKWLALFICCASLMAQPLTLHVAAEGEVAVELELSSPGSSWASEGREAALADVSVDGKFSQNVMVFDGVNRHGYRIFLGRLTMGAHVIEVARNEQYSAKGSGLQVHALREIDTTKSDILSHAPILYARKNTIGKFTDVPLIVYAERLAPATLQYTVIFSNEDGGTATRALMARWGRTTDIEYVYRLDLRSNQAIIQADGHKDIVYDGVREGGTHPFLIPTTDNNMVGAGQTSEIRYQIAPIEVDLSNDSRESVMDRFPWSYRIAAEEMQREGKTPLIGDQRQYIMIETRITNHDSAVAAVVRIKDRQYSSNLGREPMAMERDDIIRTTVQLPAPYTIDEIGFTCIALTRRPPNPKSGPCTFGPGIKVFGLDKDYKPFPILGGWNKAPATTLNTGETVAFSR